MKQSILLAAFCLCIIYVKSNPVVISVPEEQDLSQKNQVKIQEEGKKEESIVGVFKAEASSQQDESKKEEPVKEAEQPLSLDEQKQSSDAVASSSVAVAQSDAKETGRQSTSTSDDEDDDDDDDDDDDLDLGIDDDDDDDDDDGDYFDGIFDDILGDDEDDDDDDDDDEEEDEQPAPAPAAPAPAAPTVTVVEVPDTIVETVEEVVNTVEDAEGQIADSTESESLIVRDPDSEIAEASNIPEPIVVQPVPADDDEEEEEADEDDDDDDDDDDEPDLDDLASDDDDDDDDEDDDDDDDDDDVDLEDALETKRSRESKARALDQSPSSKIESVYISKYNRFVDNIIGKINRILGRSYDPVRVKIQAPKNTKKTTKNSNKKTKTKNNTKRKSTKRPASRKPEATNKMAEMEVARAHESEAREPAFVLVSKTSDATPKRNNGTVEIRATVNNQTKKTKTKTKSKTKKNKTKSNGKNGKKVPKVRATLFGLSSLKRDGDVIVNTVSDHTTVKSDFILGPLTLRVEKEFGRGAKRELKSATATTAEMFGRLNLRIIHGGAATLHSIKVLQPKQVRVDSVDNHEKTKEFMWRRSARLAKVVSRKLAAAVKSMLQPPPTTQ